MSSEDNDNEDSESGKVLNFVSVTGRLTHHGTFCSTWKLKNAELNRRTAYIKSEEHESSRSVTANLHTS